jgi:glyoxylase-like metal-dependent hydrolase (beta-lactamase superfamily II)
VVDTLSTMQQAQDLLAGIRRITPLPLAIINTHHHFDHWYGNATVAGTSPGTTIWATRGAIEALRQNADRWQRGLAAQYQSTDPALAADLAAVERRLPDHDVVSRSIMDLGDREIELRHLGRGHTDGDLVVLVPDASVVLTGDLVEEGAPPSFDDAFPVAWPDTLAELLGATPAGAIVIPGHGARVDVAFVRAQHEQLTQLAWVIRAGHADGAVVDSVAARAPYGTTLARTAVIRGYAELAWGTPVCAG